MTDNCMTDHGIKTRAYGLGHRLTYNQARHQTGRSLSASPVLAGDR